MSVRSSASAAAVPPPAAEPETETRASTTIRDAPSADPGDAKLHASGSGRVSDVGRTSDVPLDDHAVAHPPAVDLPETLRTDKSVSYFGRRDNPISVEVFCVCPCASGLEKARRHTSKWTGPILASFFLVGFAVVFGVYLDYRVQFFEVAPFYIQWEYLSLDTLDKVEHAIKSSSLDQADDILCEVSEGASCSDDDVKSYLAWQNLSRALIKSYAPVDAVYTMMIGNESVIYTLAQIHCNTKEIEKLYWMQTDQENCGFSNSDDRCEPGFMGVDGYKAPVQCPIGLFCPSGFQCAIACAFGGTCVPSSLQDVGGKETCKYPLKAEDMSDPLDGVCPGAKFLSLCKEGYYCPNATRSDQHPCPVGHYCPQGVYEPQPCPSRIFSPRHLCPDEMMAKPNLQRFALLLIASAVGVMVLTSTVWKAVQEQIKTRRMVREQKTAKKQKLRLHKEESEEIGRKASMIMAGSPIAVTFDEVEDMFFKTVDTRGSLPGWMVGEEQKVRSIFDADAEVGDFFGCSPVTAVRIAIFSSVFCFIVFICAAVDADNGALALVPMVLVIGIVSCCGLVHFERMLGAVTCCYVSTSAHVFITFGSLIMFVTSLILFFATEVGTSFILIIVLTALMLTCGLTGTAFLRLGLTCAKREEPPLAMEPVDDGEGGTELPPRATGSGSGFASSLPAHASGANFGFVANPLDASQSLDDIVSNTMASSKSKAEPKELAKVPPLNLKFNDVGLILPSGISVLKGVTGHFNSGQVSAIMGPSGAGKTTLLNVLSGKATYGRTVGDIYLNGFKSDVSNYSAIVGFVPQDDVMIRELTVRENLSYYARMRLPAGTGDAAVRACVEDTLKVLGLSHVQHSAIGDEKTRGISGGQRKRVNVGMEMVSQPSLLFLDEPTSGLDSTTSYELIDALKHMGLSGCNSILVLHQPSFALYSLFDRVLLLAKGGLTVYLGPATDALQHFLDLGFAEPENFANPADMFMDIIAGKIRPVRSSDDTEWDPTTNLTLAWSESKVRSREDASRQDLIRSLVPCFTTKMERSTAASRTGALHCRAPPRHRSRTGGAARCSATSRASGRCRARC